MNAGILITLGVFFFLLAFFISLWLRRIPTVLSFTRQHHVRLYFNEETTVTLTINYRSGIPCHWLQYSERLPLALGYSKPFQGVLYIPGHSQQTLHYTIRGTRRGIFQLGPLTVQYGDLFGFATRRLRSSSIDYVIVYPKVIPLDELLLPSRTPLGTVRSRNPLSEDPLRVIGVRDYQSGDSIRNVHWRATARVGSLQVKKLEPAMTLETIIVLDVHPELYDSLYLQEYRELAIVTAASFAHALLDARQAVGLLSNGQQSPLLSQAYTSSSSSTVPAWSSDIGRSTTSSLPNAHTPITPKPVLQHAITVPAARGNTQLLHILETLAALEPTETITLLDLLNHHTHGLGWGTTIVVISGNITEALTAKLIAIQHAGYRVLYITIGGRHASARLGGTLSTDAIPVFRIRNEEQLIASTEAFHG